DSKHDVVPYTTLFRSHRQAEADGYGRARGALPPEIRDGEGPRLTRGGPTPPGARTGGGGRPRAGRPRDRAESGQAEAVGPGARPPRPDPPDAREAGPARAGARPGA